MARAGPLLPYPAQLPQDYYAKNLPVPAPPSAPPPAQIITPPIPAPPSQIIGATNLGGVHYGVLPPDSPSFGWLWGTGQGYLYMYQEPGVWVQIGSNL